MLVARKLPWPVEDGVSGEEAPSYVDEPKSDEGTVRLALSAVELKRQQWRQGWVGQRRPRFQLLEEWIGRVEEVRQTEFRAVLVTRAEPDDRDYADIEIEEVSPNERHLVRPGAIFYWVIGYRDEAYGQRLGVSLIHFRKLVSLSKHLEDRADEQADRWAEMLDG